MGELLNDEAARDSQRMAIVSRTMESLMTTGEMMDGNQRAMTRVGLFA